MTGGAGVFQGPLPQKGSLPGLRSVITTHRQQKSCRAISTMHFYGPWRGAGASAALPWVCQCGGAARAMLSLSPSRSDCEQPGGGKEGGEDLPVHTPEAAAHLVSPPPPHLWGSSLCAFAFIRCEGHARP